MGLLGKTGVVIAGGVPLGYSAAAAGSHFMTSGLDWDMPTRAKATLAVFVNELSSGFGMGQAFTKVRGHSSLGGFQDYNLPQPEAPAGLWWTTTMIGGLMVGVDWVMGKLFKRAARSKVLGVKMLSG